MNLLEVKIKLEKKFNGWTFDIPPNLDLGVLTTNQAFKLIKNNETVGAIHDRHFPQNDIPDRHFPTQITGNNPKEIAEKLVPIIQEFLDKENLPLFAKTVGPYVNLDFKEEVYEEIIKNEELRIKNFEETVIASVAKQSPEVVGTITDSHANEKGTQISQSNLLPKIDETVLIDYFSPNVGKKMHIGHIRSADIGESLRRILSLKYNNVISNNHLGDWGIQFGMIIWGLENLDKLSLDLNIDKIKEIKNKLDLKQEFDITWEEIESYVKDINKKDYIDILYKIYVRVNQLIETEPEIKKATQDTIVKLDVILSTNQYSGPDIEEISRIDLWYWLIIVISIFQYSFAEDYLNLNKNLDKNRGINFGQIKERLVQINAMGAWKFNYLNKLYGFDLIIGESFYLTSQTIFQDLIEANIATLDLDSKAIYVDLEKEKLGRCYLISSEGYSLYHSRDIIARFVWSGIIGADVMLSLADNRQSHSFGQVFCVIQKILDSRIYETKNFGKLTRSETDRAISTLKKKMAEFVGFGFMTLPDGAMSTRKGKIVAFDELKEKLEAKVIEVLKEKSGDHLDENLIRKVAVASLKWTDLYRDRDQDIVFDFDQFLSFEGNTGVYQLYTIARLHSILEKNKSEPVIASVAKQSPGVLGTETTNLLNQTEKLLLKQTTLLPIILEQITLTYKPHFLCTYLFELATKVNSWYSKYSVNSETDLNRKAALLTLVNHLYSHLWFSLELLGIEPVEKL